MDMTRYEKVDGFTALSKLAGNERIYNGDGSYFFLDSEGLQAYDVFMDITLKSEYKVNTLISHDWYIKKPFDVRQAMRDKPDEWVGAVYKSDRDRWYKVGFDTNYFVAIEAKYDYDGPFELMSIGVERALRETLNDCIPLDEVPEDAR